ncbi:MAG: hypothetical protein ACK5MQ_10320 [Pikeienuella sp.]
MKQDRRLCLKFGGLDCEIVGYDDPLHILNRVAEILPSMADSSGRLKTAGAGGDIGDEVKERFARRPDLNETEATVQGGRLSLTHKTMQEAPSIHPRARIIRRGQPVAEPRPPIPDPRDHLLFIPAQKPHDSTQGTLVLLESDRVRRGPDEDAPAAGKQGD